MPVIFLAWNLLLPAITAYIQGPARAPFLPSKAHDPTWALASSTADISATKTSATSSTTRTAILVCPAQFCVPDDYQVLFENLRTTSTPGWDPTNTLGPTVVAPLPRTEWIKVAKQLPTRNFLEAKLAVHETLDWYFDAIDAAFAEIFATEGSDVNVCVVGHSIGGWVARAYLGGLSRSSTAVTELARKQCSSLITLGTPHISPDSALVDQTRGLLREIDEAESCSSRALSEAGIDITCVCSSGLSGDFLTPNIEQLVAASSYLPLTGKFGPEVEGDGIVPLELAFMDPPARKVVVEKCTDTGALVRHSHVLPTPWNLWNGYSPSIVLPDDAASYTSPGVIKQWAGFIAA